MKEVREKKYRRLGAVAAFVCTWLLAGCGQQPPAAQNVVQNAPQNMAVEETVTDKAVPETVTAESPVNNDPEAGKAKEEGKATVSDEGVKDTKAGEPLLNNAEDKGEKTDAPAIDRDGVYTSAEDVALYLHTYEELPENFMTKKEAKALGWSGGGLDDVAYGMCIGGDYFGNYEGLLPEDKDYHECDIDTLHQKSRGAKRLIYSEDGYIYYTADHYESFTQLYPE